ncbi:MULTISPECIES: cache domain-containing protein [Oxalobacteraceae]|jgi:signal transduction histidine kinase|uniref:cache domain-containing protein n=1 Tax=Oxalobacteraceae TaxID=75682 RepID=UPI0010A535E4|nr:MULTISPECIES: cache domain-containing protein [Oxalobacteraceae]
MNKLLAVLAFGLAAFGFIQSSVAAEKGTKEEAVALVQKAVAYIKANGKEKAYAEFTNGTQFKDRDLYIFVIKFDGMAVAHGANPKLVDKNMSELKDGDGKLFVKEFIDVAKAKGKGWVDYKWPNPVTKVIEPKSSYVERVDDTVVACGIYK